MKNDRLGFFKCLILILISDEIKKALHLNNSTVTKRGDKALAKK